MLLLHTLYGCITLSVFLFVEDAKTENKKVPNTPRKKWSGLSDTVINILQDKTITSTASSTMHGSPIVVKKLDHGKQTLIKIYFYLEFVTYYCGILYLQTT